MAFRATDGRRLDGTPSVAGRWLRAIFLEDWGLKLLALVITLSLWYGVTGQRVPVTRRLRGVQLSFLRPDDVEISNDTVEEVEVTLQGRKGEVDDLVARNLVATVDISRYKLGERVVRLTPQSVSINLPEGVRIERIEPTSIAVRLEPRIEREVEVMPQLEGKPAAGYELRGWQVTPAAVRVRGPESRVRALERVPTETISIEGLKETLVLSQTAVDILDTKLLALDPIVSVRVEVGEERIEKSFAQVRVVAGDGEQAQPSTASLRLRGERSFVEGLRPENLELVLEKMPDGSIVARLPQGLRGRVELLSTSPSQFSVK